jgi:hypothetical protein
MELNCAPFINHPIHRPNGPMARRLTTISRGQTRKIPKSRDSRFDPWLGHFFCSFEVSIESCFFWVGGGMGNIVLKVQHPIFITSYYVVLHHIFCSIK